LVKAMRAGGWLADASPATPGVATPGVAALSLMNGILPRDR
jgi:hypothetical protein